MTKFKIALVILVLFLYKDAFSQPGLSGKISIDTSLWRPVVYLSLIPDLDKMYSMSNEMIIDEAPLDNSGNFFFDTRYFPEGDNLFRIHFSKKSDPPATLNIGGKDENHFFLITGKNSRISVKQRSEGEFIKNVYADGYYPNSMIRQINEISTYLDSTALFGSVVKNDLVKKAVFEKLRIIADTCSNALVSLYAVYMGDFEKNYPVNQEFYRNFLFKWRKENTTYFNAFRKKIPAISNRYKQNSIIAIVSFTTGFLICLAIKLRKRDRKNVVQDLSLQERKIYGLVLEGKSNKEIAEVLGIELSTVKSHLTSIYSKLKISSRKDILNLKMEQEARDERSA